MKIVKQMKSTSMTIKTLLNKYFEDKHERSLKAFLNIFFSFFLKGGSVIIQFALVPITLNYLDKYQYGIWLTMASVLGWFSFFDLGIGNGLRNTLAVTLANKDLKLARIYISTSYAFISIIFITLIIIYWFINPYINWVKILNAPAELRNSLNNLTFFIFLFFSLRFILGLLGNILFADQKSAINDMISPLGNLMSLIIILVLKRIVPGSLFTVGIVYGGVPVVIYILFSIILFGGKYKEIAPSISFVDFKYLKDILGLGIKFFVIQIASLVVFTTANILLTQFFGPEEVTAYNIAYRYFTAITMIFGIILAPFWSAITEAYSNKDFDWIKSTVSKLEIVSYCLILVAIVMFFFADDIYLRWVGPAIKVPKSVSLTMVIYVIITLLGSTANTFVNGVGKIRLQLYTAMFSIIITVPLAVLFCRILNFGPAGVIMASLCTSLPTMILWRVQYNKHINGRATGIWSR